jgi:hypothetical protein
VQGFSSAQLPFFLRYRNHSTHCRATLHFSFLRIGPWHPSVSPGLQVRAVLKLTPIPLSSSITVLIADIDGFIAIAQNVKSSIKYLRYLQGLPLDSFDVPRNLVASSLSLALQSGTEAEDGTQNHVETMVAHCRKLLTSNTLTDFPVDSIVSLINAVFFEFNTLRQVRLIDQVIECVRDMVKMCPSSLLALTALANTLCIRFMTTHSMTIMRKQLRYWKGSSIPTSLESVHI